MREGMAGPVSLESFYPLFHRVCRKLCSTDPSIYLVRGRTVFLTWTDHSSLLNWNHGTAPDNEDNHMRVYACPNDQFLSMKGLTEQDKAIPDDVSTDDIAILVVCYWDWRAQSPVVHVAYVLKLEPLARIVTAIV